MASEPVNQEKNDASLDEKHLDKTLDKKRFTIREVWIISTTVVTTAILLASAVIYKDAEIKVEMVGIKSAVEKIKELQDERNTHIGEQIGEMKDDIEKLQNAVFKPK